MHCFWRHRWFSSAFFSSSKALPGRFSREPTGSFSSGRYSSGRANGGALTLMWFAGMTALSRLPPDIDLHGVIREDVAVDVAQADGALGRLVGDDGLQALALGDVIRNHRAARHPADLLLTTVDGHTGAHDAAGRAA